MALPIDNVEVVLLVDTIDFDYRKSNISYAMQLCVPLEHPVEQLATILLRRHGVLFCARNRINEIAIITDNGILVTQKIICYCTFYRG